MKKLLKSKPFSPKELFLKNIQFVMENDGVLPELQPVSTNLPFVKQFNLDIYFFFFLMTLILSFFISYILYVIIKFLMKSRRTPSTIEKKVQ